MSVAERIPFVADELHRLLPRGPLWNFRDGSIARRVLEGLAYPFAYAEELFDRFLVECDPRTTVDMLPDWERVYGLPDRCTTTSTSLVARRAAVLQLMRSPVGQTEAEIATVVHAFGLPCVVESHLESMCGLMECGDLLYDVNWSHSLTVHLPDPPVVFFEADWSGADDPLAEWVGDALQCAVGRVAPAHAALVYVYDLPNGDYQPWDPWEAQLVPANAAPSAPQVSIEEG